MAENSRVKYFDIAKGIGMLCVIAGHMGITKVNSFVFTFHMPLFFLISGYFFKNSKSTVKRNIKKLLIPYCATVIAIMLLDDLKNLVKIILGRESISSLLTTTGKWIIAGLYGSGMRTDFLNVEIPYVGAIWFLLALAWGGAFLYGILNLKILKFDWLKMLACIIIFAAGVISALWTWLPLSIQAGMTATLFLYVGYWLRQHKDGERKRIFIPACVVIWAIAFCVSYLNGNMSMASNKFPNPIINIIGAICGSYLIICLSRRLERINLICRFLAFWGENSLIVLCVHLVEQKILPWSIIYGIIPNTYVAYIVVYGCKILWATGMVILIKKFNKLRKMYLLR